MCARALSSGKSVSASFDPNQHKRGLALQSSAVMLCCAPCAPSSNGVCTGTRGKRALRPNCSRRLNSPWASDQLCIGGGKSFFKSQVRVTITFEQATRVGVSTLPAHRVSLALVSMPKYSSFQSFPIARDEFSRVVRRLEQHAQTSPSFEVL